VFLSCRCRLRAESELCFNVSEVNGVVRRPRIREHLHGFSLGFVSELLHSVHSEPDDDQRGRERPRDYVRAVTRGEKRDGHQRVNTGCEGQSEER
jgi:hypothetical protein